MANFVVPAMCLSILGGIWMHGETLAEQDSTIAFKASSDPAVNQWLLVNEETREACSIERTHKLSVKTTQVSIDAACDGVFPAIEKIALWNEDEIGNVALSDAHGNLLADFRTSPADELKTTGTKGFILSLSPQVEDQSLN